MFSLFVKKPRISTDLDVELQNQPLAISGTIPTWLSGTLIRNGPVNITIDDRKNQHWFDGLAMLHAFSFHNGHVNYSNKFLRTDAYQTVFEEGSLNYDGFAVDPCRSRLKNFFTWFMPHAKFELPNANVNVAKLAEQYVALTETPLPIRFDLKTLETVGVLDYQDTLPHEKCWESAHPHRDSRRGETLNYLIEYGPTSYYVLYRMEDGSSQREVIARIPVQEPAYMHSFAVTENYVVFTEFPFVVDPQALLSNQQSFIKNFKWEPQKGTQFLVVNRHDGQLVGRYKGMPFFAFHHANAYEKGETLYMDIVCYDNAGIVHSIADHYRATSEKENRSPARLVRFILSLKTGEIESDIIFKKFNEFPRINEEYDGHPYRFVYLADARDAMLINEIRPLYKVDVNSKEIWHWSEEGCYPGELVFVAAPDAKEEDEGVVLAVVLDAENFRSFLLVLDAKSFEEIGRAAVAHVIPAGLHGQYFPTL